MNHGSTEETLVFDQDRLQKGDVVLYEGKEAEVIRVDHLLVLKVDERVICGALHTLIDFLDE